MKRYELNDGGLPIAWDVGPLIKMQSSVRGGLAYVSRVEGWMYYYCSWFELLKALHGQNAEFCARGFVWILMVGFIACLIGINGFLWQNVELYTEGANLWFKGRGAWMAWWWIKVERRNGGFRALNWSHAFVNDKNHVSIRVLLMHVYDWGVLEMCLWFD